MLVPSASPSASASFQRLSPTKCWAWVTITGPLLWVGGANLSDLLGDEVAAQRPVVGAVRGHVGLVISLPGIDRGVARGVRGDGGDHFQRLGAQERVIGDDLAIGEVQLRHQPLRDIELGIALGFHADAEQHLRAIVLRLCEQRIHE